MILELLGVRHGVVVLTNADTIDADQLDTAQLVIGERLSRSSLRDAAIVVCDSVSGRGLDDVRVALDAALGSAPPAPDADRPRLWVDRVFAPRGAGTVVTGTLVGGAVAVGDTLEIGETGAPVRVRGIETAHRHVDRAAPGTRVALNLAGVERSTLQRGDALVRSGQWTATSVVDVAVTAAPGEQLRGRARLQAYVGSGEHEVWCQVLDDAGDLARLRFLTPIPLAPGDRVVLRDAGRECTVAGAEVLDVEPSGRRATRGRASGCRSRRGCSPAPGGCSSPTSRASPASPRRTPTRSPRRWSRRVSRCAPARHSSTGRGCSTVANGLARLCRRRPASTWPRWRARWRWTPPTSERWWTTTRSSSSSAASSARSRSRRSTRHPKPSR